MTRPFPWSDAMRFGLGTLRLSPCQFWAMTPRELAAAIAAQNHNGMQVTPPARSELQDLMQLYPDKTKGGRNG